MSARIRKSENQATAEWQGRRSTYADESAASFAYQQDRVTNRPATKRGLLRWAQRQARFDGPVRLHGRGTADDGAPKMTGEAIAYLGMTGSDDPLLADKPTNWLAVACRRDTDGDYISPMRCAIARIGAHRPVTASILRGLVMEFADDAVIVATACHPELADDVVVAALNRLYDTFTITPRPSHKRNEGLAA